MHGLKRRIAIAAGLAVALAGAILVPSAAAADKEVVAYRLVNWKTIEFEDMQKGKLHLATIKKLGCEAKEVPHSGHMDVSYRCPEWREMELKTHDSAHQWENWLKASGFETKHSH
jgi:hypothetical protein